MQTADLGRYEPLEKDQRVWSIQAQVMEEFKGKLPDDSDFLTFIQPPTTKPRERAPGLKIYVPVPAMAVFVISSPWPNHPERPDLGSTATAALRDYQGAVREWKNDGAPDPLLTIFRALAQKHARDVASLKELM